MTTDPILRAKQVKALKAWCRNEIPYPEFCRDMKCEAKTRSGAPCKNDGTVWGNGRCKFHGGCSTGPVTPEGKKRVSMNSIKTQVV